MSKREYNPPVNKDAGLRYLNRYRAQNVADALQHGDKHTLAPHIVEELTLRLLADISDLLDSISMKDSG